MYESQAMHVLNTCFDPTQYNVSLERRSILQHLRKSPGVLSKANTSYSTVFNHNAPVLSNVRMRV